jgi:hypothetical protein
MTNPSIGAVIAVFAVLVWTVSHCVFFWYVLSRDAERNLRRRCTDWLLLARSTLHANGLTDGVRSLDRYVAQRAEDARWTLATTDADAERREAHNLRRVGRWIGPVCAVLLLVLVLLVAFNVRHGYRLTYAHWIGILLALFGYVPELLLFHFTIDRYTVVPDCELFALLLGWPSPPPRPGHRAAGAVTTGNPQQH